MTFKHGQPFILCALLIGCADDARDSRDTNTESPISVVESVNASEPNAVSDTENSADLPKSKVTAITIDQLLQYALEGQLAQMVLAVEKGVDVNGQDKDGRSPLMLAAFNGHNKIAELLLANGANTNMRDSLGRTALMYAATIDNVETVHKLLENGAEVNLVDNVEGFTALMFAAGEGHVEIISILLEAGARPELCDVDGDTAFDFARNKGFKEAAQLLAP